MHSVQLQSYVEKIHVDVFKLESELKAQQILTSKARKECKHLKAEAVKTEAQLEKQTLDAKRANEQLRKLSKVAEEMRSRPVPGLGRSDPQSHEEGNRESLHYQKLLAQEKIKVETLESTLKKERDLSGLKLSKEKADIERACEEKMHKKLADAREFYRQQLLKMEEKTNTDMNRVFQKRIENLKARNEQVLSVSHPPRI
jgi:hypothetical protein